MARPDHHDFGNFDLSTNKVKTVIYSTFAPLERIHGPF